jgi:hypothetical protein
VARSLLRLLRVAIGHAVWFVDHGAVCEGERGRERGKSEKEQLVLLFFRSGTWRQPQRRGRLFITFYSFNPDLFVSSLSLFLQISIQVLFLLVSSLVALIHTHKRKKNKV